MRKYVVPAVSFFLCFAFFCSPLIVSAAPASSFESIEWAVWNEYGKLLFTRGYDITEISETRSDYSNSIKVQCAFRLPANQTDTVVSFRVGHFRPYSVSAYVYDAGLQIGKLTLETFSSNYVGSDLWYQLDCSTLGGSYIVATFLLENTQVGDATFSMGAYVNSLDNAKPDGWLSRIWNAIRNGFSAVGEWISAQTSVLVAKFDELIGHFAGTPEQQQEAEQQGNAQAQQQQDINGSVNDLGQMQRPDLGNVDTGQFQNIQVPTAFSAIVNQPMIVQMFMAVGTLAIFSYLLYGKRG